MSTTLGTLMAISAREQPIGQRYLEVNRVIERQRLRRSLARLAAGTAHRHCEQGDRDRGYRRPAHGPSPPNVWQSMHEVASGSWSRRSAWQPRHSWRPAGSGPCGWWHSMHVWWLVLWWTPGNCVRSWQVTHDGGVAAPLGECGRWQFSQPHWILTCGPAFSSAWQPTQVVARRFSSPLFARDSRCTWHGRPAPCGPARHGNSRRSAARPARAACRHDNSRSLHGRCRRLPASPVRRAESGSRDTAMVDWRPGTRARGGNRCRRRRGETRGRPGARVWQVAHATAADATSARAGCAG